MLTMGGGWALQTEDPLTTHRPALALDDHTLEEVFEAFRDQEPRFHLVDRVSPVRAYSGMINLPHMFFRALPLDKYLALCSRLMGCLST